MNRYIDAERLVAWCMETYKTQSTVSGKAYVRALLDAVDSCPTADVVEVRHGEWELDYEYADDYSNDNVRKVFRCSLCGRTERRKEPYCNCGAKMNGERKEEDD